MTGRPLTSLSAAYFEALYAADPDPWKFLTSDYEAAKYATTLEALREEPYEHGLEVGCSIGVLTGMLVPHCRRLTAVDSSARAVAAARRHCGLVPSLSIQRREVPGQWPNGRYDLILLSEVVYYWDERDLAQVASLVRRDLMPGGDVLLVHWIGNTDYPLSGDAAVEAFIQHAAGVLQPVRQDRYPEYRLDLLRREA